jgi:hypothetical protein
MSPQRRARSPVVNILAARNPPHSVVRPVSKREDSFSNESLSTAQKNTRLRPWQHETGGGASKPPILSENVPASQPADFEHTDCSRPDIFAEMDHYKKCASPLTLHSVDKNGYLEVATRANACFAIFEPQTDGGGLIFSSLRFFCRCMLPSTLDYHFVQLRSAFSCIVSWVPNNSDNGTSLSGTLLPVLGAHPVLCLGRGF